jgi:hypothetical protein
MGENLDFIRPYLPSNPPVSLDCCQGACVTRSLTVTVVQAVSRYSCRGTSSAGIKQPSSQDIQAQAQRQHMQHGSRLMGDVEELGARSRCYGGAGSTRAVEAENQPAQIITRSAISDYNLIFCFTNRRPFLLFSKGPMEV